MQFQSGYYEQKKFEQILENYLDQSFGVLHKYGVSSKPEINTGG